MVWVADDQRGVVVTIDERTGKVVGSPIKVGPSPVALASDSAAVWVADATGGVKKIGIRDRVPLDQMNTDGVLSGIAVADGALWLTDVQNGRLFEQRLGYQPGGPTPPVSLPAGAVRVAVDGQSVWVTNGDNTVTRVDAKTLVADPPTAVGNGPIGLAVRDGVVWVTNSDDDTVSRILVGSQTGPAPATKVGKGPIAVAAGADGAWVVSQDARQLTRLALATGKVARSLPVDTRGRGVVLGADRVWIVGVDPDVVIGVLRSALGGAA
jgi:DNA-binding beta-propeller fold protein YncE